jgi:hypothetical protein
VYNIPIQLSVYTFYIIFRFRWKPARYWPHHGEFNYDK